MDKIKILVAQHKKTEVYSDDVYTPIHVGKALSKTDIGIMGDDTGNNISHLNPYYCELSAQYWAWKNMPNVEYIGLCHYRRYFQKVFTPANIDDEMNDCDIILSRRKLLGNNILRWMSDLQNPDDIGVFHLYMTKRFPSQIAQYEKFFIHTDYIHPANMLICRKPLFDKFCEWQFDILEGYRHLIPQGPYARNKRILGYLGEPLLCYYAYLNNLRIREYPLVTMIGSKAEEYYHQSPFRKLQLKIKYATLKHKYIVDPAIMVSLKSDGIVTKIEELYK